MTCAPTAPQGTGARGYNHHSDPAAELLRERGQQFAIPAEDFLGVGDVIEHRATNDGSVLPNLVACECERRHDTEVAAAAAERPEEILMGVIAGGDEAAISKHEVGTNQVVDAEAEPS